MEWNFNEINQTQLNFKILELVQNYLKYEIYTWSINMIILFEFKNHIFRLLKLF